MQAAAKVKLTRYLKVYQDFPLSLFLDYIKIDLVVKSCLDYKIRHRPLQKKSLNR